MAREDGFNFDIYIGSDGIPVVHVGTPAEWDNVYGPRCRVYLNEEPVYQNPVYEPPEPEKPS